VWCAATRPRKLNVRKRHQFVCAVTVQPRLLSACILERDMCRKCAELDERITRYRKVAGLMLDQLALSSIKLLIERCEAQKLKLHLSPVPQTV
jgi:hypothetical protein